MISLPASTRIWIAAGGTDTGYTGRPLIICLTRRLLLETASKARMVPRETQRSVQAIWARPNYHLTSGRACCCSKRYWLARLPLHDQYLKPMPQADHYQRLLVRTRVYVVRTNDRLSRTGTILAAGMRVRRHSI